MWGTKFWPRYTFKFLIKINWEDHELKLNKVGPTLNQLGVEDPASADELIYSFFNGLDWDAIDEDCELYGRVDLTLWKVSSNFTRMNIKPINLEALLKGDVDMKNLKEVSRKGLLSRKALYFDLGFLAQLGWTGEDDYRFSLKNLPSFRRWTGTFPTYSKRKEMLGRKINFRRKIQKKKFEEY